MIKKVCLFLALLPMMASGQLPSQKEFEAMAEHSRARAQAGQGDITRILTDPLYLRRMNETAADPFFARAAEQAQNIGMDSARQMLPAGRTPDQQAMIDNGVDTVVFISRSMPEQSLMALFNQGAGSRKTVFVMRGWGSADIRDAFKWTDQIRERLGGREPNILIHPAAFDAYRIDKVPAMVHKDTDGKWYLIQGTTSLEDTVAHIRERRFDQVISRQWPVKENSQIEEDRKGWASVNWQQQESLIAAELKAQIEGKITLPWASESKSYAFKPYFELSFDMRNHEGRLLLPKGSRINLLAANPGGKTVAVFIDGRDDWQVDFAAGIKDRYPAATVFYTKLGGIEGRVKAFPLTEEAQNRLQVRVVPSVYVQNGTEFQVRTFRRQ